MKKLLVILCVFALALPAFAAEMRVANGAEVESIDPHLISSVNAHRVYMALFEGLVSPDPATTAPLPGVASSWTVSKDQATFTFTIRKGIVWSDGTPITAQTVYDSWLRCLNPETGAEYASMLYVIKGAADYNQGKGPASAVAMKVINPTTFQFSTIGSTSYAISMLTHYAFAIVPTHVIAKWGKDWVLPEHFVGDGPFVLSEYRPQDGSSS